MGSVTDDHRLVKLRDRCRRSALGQELAFAHITPYALVFLEFVDHRPDLGKAAKKPLQRYAFLKTDTIGFLIHDFADVVRNRSKIENGVIPGAGRPIDGTKFGCGDRPRIGRAILAFTDVVTFSEAVSHRLGSSPALGNLGVTRNPVWSLKSKTPASDASNRYGTQ